MLSVSSLASSAIIAKFQGDFKEKFSHLYTVCHGPGDHLKIQFCQKLGGESGYPRWGQRLVGADLSNSVVYDSWKAHPRAKRLDYKQAGFITYSTCLPDG